MRSNPLLEVVKTNFPPPPQKKKKNKQKKVFTIVTIAKTLNEGVFFGYK